MCTQIIKATGNEEIGHPPVQSNRAGGWGNHGRTTNCVLCTSTRKHLKATGNGKTGQPPVQSNRGRWLRKSLSDNCVLSTGTPKHLKANENGETGQLPVQSNRKGGSGNHCRTTVS
ncbi:hypothetical protein L3X38_011907 [Prunus dulcis]|uniref:Uncharacterized protein n=1 Tax=Prunus dulcis TaxID=3755 RepID=A0AAD4WIA9_PRUDU|nr:hypothetical protein L3X38_011907 [Prunus dulcis]